MYNVVFWGISSQSLECTTLSYFIFSTPLPSASAPGPFLDLPSATLSWPSSSLPCSHPWLEQLPATSASSPTICNLDTRKLLLLKRAALTWTYSSGALILSCSLIFLLRLLRLTLPPGDAVMGASTRGKIAFLMMFCHGMKSTDGSRGRSRQDQSQRVDMVVVKRCNGKMQRLVVENSLERKKSNCACCIWFDDPLFILLVDS